MIPEIVARILGIIEDLTGERYKTSVKLTNIIPTHLWEGFEYDLQVEFEVPNLQVDPNWSVWETYEEILKAQATQDTVMPESTLIIHFDDEHVNCMLDDLETVLEKYQIPYVMKLYTHREGQPLKKEPLLRASSNEEIFDAYHEQVMKMFKREDGQ